MPAFPKSVHRVLQLTSDLNFQPKDLVSIIDHDPVMTLKILRMVNASYFGLSRKITSINHAVVFVGINTVKNLALSVATRGMLPKINQGGLDTNQFLLHSVGCGAIAKLLARRLGVSEKDSTDFFVAGLLHDFGKVVFSQYMPEEFREAMRIAKERGISLCEAERITLDADHTLIGATLGERWQLPEELVRAIREHHDPGPEECLLRDCVFVANQMAKKLEIGFAGDALVADMPERLRERFGMDYDGLCENLENLWGELERARLFIHV
ncbi:HDOD domain-containing protein [Magnetofaba australis]|nr:HDOD domain-containing protein [Magnetofaba australis]